ATTLIAEGFGDVNGDGLTNSTDALIILTFDAGLPVQFPVGEETCPDDASALGGLLTDPAPAAAPKSFGAAIDASFVPATTAKAGEIVEVPVVVDMNGTGAALGSYGAQLRWNPEVYELVSYAGGTTEGFASPVMNVSETDAGKLAIAHAYVAGATGEVNVFNLRLLQKVDAPAAADLDLEFTSMAAAGTFETLAPRVNTPQVPTLELLPVKVFPNPFASELTVQFSLPAAADTEVAVFDATGRLVRTLVTGERTAGSHVVTWDGIGEGSVRASGVYLIKVVSGELEATRRVVLQ
ncbi:MAG: FlgD immunoglobulin-like domain containing protein, partial [Bacteroidota bacterium]